MARVNFLVFVVLFLICNARAVDVAFEDVTVHGYAFFVHKFEIKISSSNNLKETLPTNIPYDGLEIKEQNIPVLFESCISDLEDLDELTLEGDGITEIRPGALKNLPQLRKLSLKGNKLEEIKKGVFNSLAISSLDLSKNSLFSIDPKAFNDMPDLININLADNKISKWDKNWFENTPLLSRVSMQNNLISQLPNNAFKNLAGEKTFGSLTLELNIILSYNKIENLNKKAFENVKDLNNLWLDNNNIASIDSDVFGDMKISDLKLGENQIQCLHEDFIKNVKAKSIDLDGNPWNCTCLNEMKKWVEENDKQVQLFYSEMNCDAERIRIKLNDLQTRLKELAADEDY